MQKDPNTYEQIMVNLSRKIYSPVYFLSGEEPYYIDKISDYIAKNVLKEEEKSFNQSVIYGKETDAAAITNTAKRYPMMSNHQVLIVKEAQEIKNIEDLIYYIENPLSSTILVINYKYKTLDKRKKFYKAVQGNSVFWKQRNFMMIKYRGGLLKS